MHQRPAHPASVLQPPEHLFGLLLPGVGPTTCPALQSSRLVSSTVHPERRAPSPSSASRPSWKLFPSAVSSQSSTDPTWLCASHFWMRWFRLPYGVGAAVREPHLFHSPEGSAPSAGIEIITIAIFRNTPRGGFLVSELSTHGLLGTYWQDIKEKGTSYEAQQVTPHLVVTKDSCDRPAVAPCGPDGATLAEQVKDHHIRVRIEAVLADGLNSSRSAPEGSPQAAGFPMDAGMQKALDDAKDFSERSRTGRP